MSQSAALPLDSPARSPAPSPEHAPEAHEDKLAGLDGLRAVAVLMVLLFHDGMMSFGWVGVQIFFVLSGYLISRLLYRRRDTRLFAYVRDFYARRALRIFPLYFAVLVCITLACAAGMHMDGVREGLPFAWTYTYNVFEAMHTFIYSKMIGHFWSLCVEEQVYLVWPFVIYFCPPSKLKALLGGLVLLGPLVRLTTWLLVKVDPAPFNEHADMAVYVLTPSHIDAFALGAMTAIFPPRQSRKSLALAVAALVVAGGVVMWFSKMDPAEVHRSLGYPVGLAAGYAFVWGYSLLNVCTAFCIDCLTRHDLWPRFFESKPMAALGKVSYGIYMFHFPLQAFVGKVIPARLAMARMPIQVVTAVGLASLSYVLFESRFLSLKSRLPPLPRAGVPAAVPPPAPAPAPAP